MRRNLFEILSEKEPLDDRIEKLNILLDSHIEGINTLEELIEEYCFRDWKARGNCTSCLEIRERAGITDREVSHDVTEQKALLFLEYLSNMIWLMNTKVYSDELYYEDDYSYLQENSLSLIEDLGHETKVFEDQERVLLVEKNAAATAAAELSDSNLAYDIIEYNHFLMRGDLEGKKQILLKLADQFEPNRNDLKAINQKLESNIGFLLNNMNIRHNNVNGKNSSEYIKHISPEELEEWYDETYQMLLLSILELDNVERNRKVDELKKKMNR